MTRRGREDWKKLVATLETSELTHKEFAAEKGVSLATLQFWLYKLRRESRHESRAVILPVELVGSPAPLARQPSERAVPASGAAPLELALPSGALLRFSSGTDVGYLRQLLAALG